MLGRKSKVLISIREIERRTDLQWELRTKEKQKEKANNVQKLTPREATAYSGPRKANVHLEIRAQAQKAHQHSRVKSIKESEQTTLHKNQEKSCQKSNSCHCWHVPERAKFKAPSGCRFGDNCAYKHTAKPADEKNSASIAVHTEISAWILHKNVAKISGSHAGNQHQFHKPSHANNVSSPSVTTSTER